MKKRLPHALLFWMMALSLFQCGPGEQATSVEDAYLDGIEEWRSGRLAALKKPDGWLSLDGLFWLEKDRNVMGSGPESDFIIASSAIPRILGVFHRQEDKVMFRTRQAVRRSGEVIREIEMRDDSDGSPTRLSYGAYRWNLIRRGDRLGIRLRRLDHPRIRTLSSIPHYPVDPDWKVRARLVPYESPRFFKVQNAVGVVEEISSPGRLEFRLMGRSCSLIPFPGSGKELFLVIADETSGKETYGGGRFITAPAPDDEGWTTIDFNRAINPPCVFTPYATCPYPIPENRLPVAITAGEKVVKGFH